MFRASAAEQPEILYTCQYAPNIDITLTKVQIYNIVASNDVEAVFYLPADENYYLESQLEQIEINEQQNVSLPDSSIPVVWQKLQE